MKSAQYKELGKVLIHPTTCSSLQKVLAFQRRTGLQIVINQFGTAQAIPAQCAGGAV
ncbi:hypothetical protein [Pseudomonas sp. Irchel s3f19]|uniref:hypothetical protein n=1 Tax=Pseudomonas sp. Irchel s3f19 TaxID=2009146 RepID=UPI001359B9E5|nr:hypothetical protein [Pseudomonas sp. Irchel s3f19]